MTDPTPEIILSGKRTAARAAAYEVEDGMLVGLGTGSTSALAIRALAERVQAGLRIECAATSEEAGRLATSLGLIVLDFATLGRLDLAIDGADEIDPSLRAIKGAGGAMLREKIVATAADRMIAIVDQSKLVDTLGSAALPIEVLPFGLTSVAHALERLGAVVDHRMVNGSPYVTDQGNSVLDCHFGRLDEPERLAALLSEIPGVMAHGLFVNEIDLAFVGSEGTAHKLVGTRCEPGG